MNKFQRSVQNISSSLFWRISLAFLAILLILAFFYVYMTARTAEHYYQEASQNLNGEIAAHIASDIKPFVDGEVNQEALEHLFHQVMIVNPSIEVYLLDTNGVILSYFAPHSKVVLDTITLEPIQAFIAKDSTATMITGPDPRHPERQKVFSAAEVTEEGQRFGYIYVVLASEEYDSAMGLLLGSYRLRLATRTAIITFVAALILGLLAIWLITRNLKVLQRAVKRFQNGDLKARAHLKGAGELSQLADAFNSMADKIVRNIEELKSVENLRRELIANVSHDLRTPLATIQGYSETLLMKAKELEPGEREKFTEIILRGTNRIKEMVEELFELSKLEAKQIEVQYEPFSLQELVEDIMQQYRIMAGKYEIDIKTDLPKDLPFLYADIALIDRVIQNLIQNAIKYTPKGGTVMIESEVTDKGVKLMISDTGLGIPEDELPYIFERYRRGKNNEDAATGTGLGLTIVKKILELHNTTIQVFSKPNEGTTFSFELAAYQRPA